MARRRRPRPPKPPTGVVLRRLLRLAVFDYVAAKPSRAAAPALWVGTPGSSTVRTDLTERVDRRTRLPRETDHTLRVDQIAAMVVRAGGNFPLVWLTRSGSLTESHAVDADWLAAAIQAFAELDLPLVFVVVNRHGWRDPRTGDARIWQRVRIPATAALTH